MVGLNSDLPRTVPVVITIVYEWHSTRGVINLIKGGGGSTIGISLFRADGEGLLVDQCTFPMAACMW